MVSFIALFGCDNRADREKDLSCFRLPTVRQKHGEQTLQLSEERWRMWLSNIGRSDIKISNFPYTRVCSDHFVSGKPADLYNKLNVDWAPTLKLGHVKVLLSPSAATDRYNRVLCRVKKRKRHDAAETIASLQDVLVDDQTCLTEESVDHNTREIQTDLIGHNLEAIQQELLIGISPQGTISFLSQAWCGRASDTFVTENSGFLNKLLPGDIVIADRGFDVKDSIGVMMASVKMPAFTKGMKLIPALELEESRRLAHFRIHVERVIGLMRQKHTFLSGIALIDHLRTTDDKGLTTID